MTGSQESQVSTQVSIQVRSKESMTRPDTELKAHTVDTRCIHEGVQV